MQRMNATSRTSVVAMLLAAELLIAGMAVYSLRGGFAPGFASFGHQGAGGGEFVAKSIAPIMAGLSPSVTIDDPNSGVQVSASTDGMIHVKDDTYFHSWFGGGHRDYPQLKVTQDLSGVHVTRASAEGDFTFGNSREHIEVQVPAGSSLVIGHCESAEISGLNNGVTVTSQDGHIDLTDMRGTIVAHSDDGHITASRITTSSLDVSSADGYVEGLNLDLIGTAPMVKLHSNDGHVTATGRFPAGGTYDFSTNDGKGYVTLEPGSDVTLDASTDDGAIHVDGERRRDFDHGDPASGVLHFGSGASTMRLHSQDGSLYITTNGVH
jgi:Toastrack DUF4097